MLNNRLSAIRELRKKQNLSMKELGALIGVSESTISLYENGKRQPDYDTLIKISNYFNVSLDYLLGQNRDLVDTKDTLSLDEKQLIKKYRLLDTYGQKAVNHMLDIEYERCSPTEDPSENQQVLSYVARTGERGTITKSKSELDEIFSKLKPDTSEQY